MTTNRSTNEKRDGIKMKPYLDMKKGSLVILFHCPFNPK